MCFAWLDWLTHRSIAFILVVGGGLIVAAIFGSRITATITSATDIGSAEWTRLVVEAWRQLPAPVRRLLVSLIPLLYFLLRGQGTSGAGMAVAVAGITLATVFSFLGGVIDPPLQGFYNFRDRWLARWLRFLTALVLGVLIAFQIVHGSLRDLPALFGGKTKSPQSPVDLSGRFFIATMLAGLCTALLLREGLSERD